PWSGGSETLLRDVVPAGTPIGTARTGGGLERLGGATLTVAGHDHQAAVVGVGSSGAGDEFDSCGTAEAILRTIPPGPEPSAITTLARVGVTVGWHAIRDRWCLLGATQGGLILGRVQAALGVGPSGLAGLDAAPPPARPQPAPALSRPLDRAAGPRRDLIVAGGWTNSAALMAAKTEAFGSL